MVNCEIRIIYFKKDLLYIYNLYISVSNSFCFCILFYCKNCIDNQSLFAGRKPVIVVGNKIDLLGRTDEHFIKHVKKCLLNSLEETGFEKASLLHLAVISAKTGFGVERLISTLQRIWGTRGKCNQWKGRSILKKDLFRRERRYYSG